MRMAVRQLCALMFCWTGLLGAAGGCHALCTDCMARRCSDAVAAANALSLQVPHVVHTQLRRQPCRMHLLPVAHQSRSWTSWTGQHHSGKQARNVALTPRCINAIHAVLPLLKLLGVLGLQKACQGVDAAACACEQALYALAFLTTALSGLAALVHALVLQLFRHAPHLPPCAPAQRLCAETYNLLLVLCARCAACLGSGCPHAPACQRVSLQHAYMQHALQHAWPSADRPACFSRADAWACREPVLLEEKR